MHLEHHTASQHYLGARSLACYGEKELGYSQLLCWGMEELGRCFAVLMVEGALHLLGGWGKAKREFGCSLPCTRWSFSSGLLLLVCREQEESVPTVCLLSFHLELLDCCFLPLLDYQRLGQNGGNAKYLQPWVKSPSSPFLCHWATNITVTRCSMEHLALAGEWTSQCKQPFPHLAFDTKRVSQLESSCGVGSAHTAWPACGPLKLTPAGPMQLSPLASQSLIEGQGNQ